MFLLLLLYRLIQRLMQTSRLFKSKQLEPVIPYAKRKHHVGERGRRKPDWVGSAVLLLFEQTNLSHRKLADLFNQIYSVSAGVSVGRTWVRQLLMKQDYAALHARQQWKHQMPQPFPVNQIWGVDTTYVADIYGVQHIAFGIIDRGSRLCIGLRYIRRFNAWTCLECLLLAFGEYGRPCFIKSDNHAVFRSRMVKACLRLVGVKRQFSKPASPWQNGYVERMFGTMKAQLDEYAIGNWEHLTRALSEFRFWYNAVRPHQHLMGRTLEQVWQRIDPYRTVPKEIRWFSGWDGKLRGWVLRH